MVVAYSQDQQSIGVVIQNHNREIKTVGLLFFTIKLHQNKHKGITDSITRIKVYEKLVSIYKTGKNVTQHFSREFIYITFVKMDQMSYGKTKVFHRKLLDLKSEITLN